MYAKTMKMMRDKYDASSSHFKWVIEHIENCDLTSQLEYTSRFHMPSSIFEAYENALLGYTEFENYLDDIKSRELVSKDDIKLLEKMYVSLLDLRRDTLSASSSHFRGKDPKCRCSKN
ncbi:MAG: hypothetical protein WC390_12415 [Sulfurimonas sp.]